MRHDRRAKSILQGNPLVSVDSFIRPMYDEAYIVLIDEGLLNFNSHLSLMFLSESIPERRA
jgi:hypothetical protein